MTSSRALATAGLLISFFAVSRATAVEHPGSLEKDADCTSCHTKQITGKSVHSAMQSPCGVCHVTSTQGDMTLVSLSMPKNKICFACHEAAQAHRIPAAFLGRDQSLRSSGDLGEMAIAAIRFKGARKYFFGRSVAPLKRKAPSYSTSEIVVL